MHQPARTSTVRREPVAMPTDVAAWLVTEMTGLTIDDHRGRVNLNWIWIWPAFVDRNWSLAGSRGEEDPLAEEVELRAAEHLPLDHFDAVDVALYGAGAVRQGQSIEDSGVVAFEARGVGVQLGDVVGLDRGDPGVQAVGVAAGEHVTERGHVIGDRVEVLAAGADLFEPDLFLGVQIVVAAQNPAGDVPHLRRPGRRRRRGADRPEGTQIAAQRAVAAPIAEGLDLGEQLRRRRAALVPALVQMVGEGIQDAGPAADAGGGQQVLHPGGASEATHRLPGQTELADDRLDRLALGAQRLDLLVALPGAFDQPAVLDLLGGGFGGDLAQAGLRSLRRCGRRARGLGQAAMVTGHRLLDMLGQVVPQMEAVRDLDRLRRPGAGTLGVSAGPVPADDLHAGTGTQPIGQRVGFPVG